MRLEKRRLVAPYRVTTARGAAETELVYSYEEDVFDPEDPSDLNLAQRHRRRRSRSTTASSATRSSSGDLSTPSTGPFSGPPPETPPARSTSRSSSSRTPSSAARPPAFPPSAAGTTCGPRLSFPDAVETRGAARAAWSTSREQHAVLSSGGKDSLLTYGLLPRARSRTPPDLHQRVGSTLVHGPERLPALRRPAFPTPRGSGPTPTGCSPGCCGTCPSSARTSPTCAPTSTRSGSGRWRSSSSGPCRSSASEGSAGC